MPYDSGHRSLRMGAGPEHFVLNGVEQVLRDCGHDVQVDCIEAQDPFRAEIKTAFELYKMLSDRVSAASDKRIFPLVLSGNCSSTLGTVAGAGTDQLGVVWFDTHGDLNTPDTTDSGFLDGMGLATALGRCWQKMAASITNFTPLAGRNILHVGGRDLSPEEKALLEQSGGTIIDAEAVRKTSMREVLEQPLNALKSSASRIHLHFDLDVIDPRIAPANEFVAPRGLSLAQVQEAIQMIGERFTICSGVIAAYDPEYDENHEILAVGFEIMKCILANARYSPAVSAAD